MSTSPVPDLSTFFAYEYEVDLAGNSAAAHVIRISLPCL